VSELLSLGLRDVVDALRHRARKTLDPAVVEYFASASKAVITEVTSGDPRVQVLDAEPSPVVQIGEADLPRIARAFGELADLKNPFTMCSISTTKSAFLPAPRLSSSRSSTTSWCAGNSVEGFARPVGRSTDAQAAVGCDAASERWEAGP
jgi:hypothetical protein